MQDPPASRPSVRRRTLLLGAPMLGAPMLGAPMLGAMGLGAPARAEPVTLRFGHFPNVTHIQGLVAHAMSRAGEGWFEQRLGPDVKLEWFVYNAGPSAIEAIFARSIDVTYIGPSPAINGYARARGEDIRILAGAAEGGAGLVVHAGSGLRTAADFRGKRIATPQLGNTQDVAARAWLQAGGLRVTLTGGDAEVVPTENPDQLALFARGLLDGVWTVEPWISRLETEAGGQLLVEQADAVTTVLVSSAAFLGAHRPLLHRLVEAHEALTQWIVAHPDQAQSLARAELLAETRTPIDPALVARAWSRIKLTSDISPDALDRAVATAKQVGTLRTAPDLSRLVDRP